MRPHIVYLANSSGAKVGITRQENIPSRWVDQGAVQALPVMGAMTRQQSGFAEVAFKKLISDKTQWRKMLRGEHDQLDLMNLSSELMTKLKPDFDRLNSRFGMQALFPIEEPKEQVITYPVLNYPTKVVSLNLDKTPEITGKLQGIKGQYLILDIGVINLRKFTSYKIEITMGHSVYISREDQLNLL